MRSGRTLTNKKYIGVYTYNGEVEGGCPPIVDKKTFDKASCMLEKIRKSPAHNKVREADYLLTGKVFCGYYGAPIVGESGRGKSDTTYNYYACVKKKKNCTCHKKNEKKGFLEWYLVEQVVEYVLTPSRIDLIAERVVAEYIKGFNSFSVKALESKLREIDRELDKLVDALIKTESKTALAKINYKIARLRLGKRVPILSL